MLARLLTVGNNSRFLGERDGSRRPTCKWSSTFPQILDEIINIAKILAEHLLLVFSILGLGQVATCVLQTANSVLAASFKRRNQLTASTSKHCRV